MLHEAISVTSFEGGGGKALLVTAPIPKGTVVWWENQDEEPDWVSIPRCRLYIDNLPAEARKIFEHYMYKVGEDAYESLPEFDRLPHDQWKLGVSDDPSMFMNHSCAPTCWFEPDELYKNDGVVVMTATRDLVPGDELTFDYATSEDVEQNWRCLCGERTCRGRVTGDDWKDPAFQAKYRGHCMPHVEALMANAANDAALGLFAFADLRRSGEIGGAFWSPEDVAKAGRAKLPEAFWSAEKCREEASNVAAQVPLAIKTPPPGPDSWGRHLVYLPEQDGEEAMAAPIVAGQTVMLMPPNLLLRDRQMKGRRGYMGTLYNAALQVRPSAQRPGALYSLSETPEDLDNYINHSCDPNCDVEVFPTNYLIKLTANRDIFPGEPVTIDYETTEEDMVAQGDQFECECGSENCRGRILGWKYRTARGPIAIPLKVGAEVDSVTEVTAPARPGVLQPLVEPVSATA